MRVLIMKIWLLLLLPLPVIARTIVVAPNGAVSSLKQAVERAKNGDTIIVKKGIYTSVNTLINKELTILGQDDPVLDARFREEVVTILSSHVKFDGFVIKNSKTGSMR
ncbi:MAG TPA: hypothetical protein VJ844_09695, partial [Mucilaginibacter sp.]|nr:hypothetical protein [Mucilaginibacter sp.]